MTTSKASPDLATVFKICPRADWEAARRDGRYLGSSDDLRDGFIHLSARHQLTGTARRHFRGQPGLVVIAFATADLGPALRWEPSRGGDLFPHLHGPLPVSAARAVADLPLGDDGIPKLPEHLT